MGRKSQERGRVVLPWKNYSTSSVSFVTNVVSRFSVFIGIPVVQLILMSIELFGLGCIWYETLLLVSIT